MRVEDIRLKWYRGVNGDVRCLGPELDSGIHAVYAPNPRERVSGMTREEFAAWAVCEVERVEVWVDVMPEEVRDEA